MIKSKLNRQELEKLIEHFCKDIDATQTALSLSINRKTVNRYYNLFRMVIYNHQQNEDIKLWGVIEVGRMSVFDGKDKNIKRKFKSAKFNVFGLFERGGRVCTVIYSTPRNTKLESIVKEKVTKKSLLIIPDHYTYTFWAFLYEKDFEVVYAKKNSENEVHTDGIKSFWNFYKKRIEKFNGVKGKLHLHIKESEWRWGKNFNSLYEQLLSLVEIHLMV
ncbi:MAG TPA: transposase [Candidatus Babeliales bacterium]|jgi:transposase-like protein|nr:transposase [Candidatus Babeliales bacterium]